MEEKWRYIRFLYCRRMAQLVATAVTNGPLAHQRTFGSVHCVLHSHVLAGDLPPLDLLRVLI